MNIRVSKALFAYSTTLGMTYYFTRKIWNEQYLKDVAFTYHRNFTNKLTCP